MLCAVAGVGVGGLYLWRGTQRISEQSTSSSLRLGEPDVLATATIGIEGGTIRVDQPGSALDGLTIEVPSGAFSHGTLFEISSLDIESHTFGSDVNPITPLIRIESDGPLADEFLSMTIPVRIEVDEFAMAFAYETQSPGVLEGMALLESTSTLVKVTTRHISRDVLVSSIPKERLEIDIDTGFEHGVDDWPFVNYGSYISPGGHCAGQSLSAMYYFIEDLGPPLFGQYDNYDNPFQDTPGLFWDDELGYRLASVTQESIDWGSQGRKFWLKYATSQDDRMTYNAFAYSMMVTSAPQYVGIYGKDEEGKPIGHAMIIYGKQGETFSISDPNYPWGAEGGEERTITYNVGEDRFDPYYSGPNADDLGHAYGTIVYFGYQDLIDWDLLGELWQELEDGFVGSLEFPGYELAVTEGDSGVEEELWFNHVSAEEDIIVRVRDAGFRPYLVTYDASTNLIAKGGEPLGIRLAEGDNYLGFMILALIGRGEEESLEWVGFDWIKVIYEKEQATLEATQAGEEEDEGPDAGKQDFGVFIAEGEVLVGSKSELEQTPTCSLRGWGVNCDETVGERTILNTVLGLFGSREEAVEAFCSNFDPASIWYPPLVSGSKGIFMGQEVWVSNAPACP